MKVLIIDDDPLVCLSLKTILDTDPDIRVIGISHKAEDATGLYEMYRPDVVLMDIRMKGINGLEAAEALLKIFSEAKILFLTTFSDDEYIIKALRIGAKGYILKQHFETIALSLKAVFCGQRVFGDEIISRIPSLLGNSINNDPSNILTEKELEILRYVAQGLSNQEISEILYLSKGTIRNYISVILEKLKLRDRTQLAIYYYKTI